MRSRHLIATIAFAAVCLAASPVAMALGAGDFFDNRQGVNINSGDAAERRLGTTALDGATDSGAPSHSGRWIDAFPLGHPTLEGIPLFGPLSGHRLYVGVGLQYRHISEETLEALDADAPLSLVGGTALGEANLDPVMLDNATTFHF